MRVSIPFVSSGTILAVFFSVSVISPQPPVRNAEEATKTIPLESCFATPEISGCTHVKRGSGEPYSGDLETLIGEHQAGASNVVLVRGNDIAEAIMATRLVFVSGVRADAPVPPKPGDTQTGLLPLWVVAYFGMGPSEPGFGRVHSAEIRGRTVRVTYSRAHAKRVSDDVHRYYFWAPLGKADAGTYALELFDAVRNEVLLVRRVVVPAK